MDPEFLLRFRPPVELVNWLACSAANGFFKLPVLPAATGWQLPLALPPIG